MQLFPLSPIGAPAAIVLQRLACAWFQVTAAGLLWLPASLVVLSWHHAWFSAFLAVYMAYILGPGRKACMRCDWPMWLRRCAVSSRAAWDDRGTCLPPTLPACAGVLHINTRAPVSLAWPWHIIIPCTDAPHAFPACQCGT